MSKVKRAVSILLCVVLLLGSVVIGGSEFAQILTTAANAEDATNGTCGENLTWSYNTSTQTLIISGTGWMHNYHDSYDYNTGTFVTDAPWQPFFDTMQTLVIDNGVTDIGYYAFCGCTGLTSVTIPDSITDIGYYAFCGCTGLTSVTIPDSVTDIGDNAFRDCAELTSVTIGNGVTSIGWYAFESCSGLTSVMIPNSVIDIGKYAFWGCTGLTSVTIGSGVTDIGDNAFRGCTGLTSVTIPDSVTSIGVQAFQDCTGLTSITIPDSVTSIGGSAFSGCTGLTSVTIPDSVTSIGSYAFSNCTGLTDVTIGSGVTSIGSGAFYYCTGLTQITVASGNPIYHSAGNCLIETGSNTLVTGCKNSVIPADGSVTSFGPQAFALCAGLTSITIPGSTKRIGVYAFFGCTGLMSVTIPDSVTSVGSAAFYNCTGLTSVTIGNGVTSIEAAAFSGCTGLTSITIPDSVTSIGSSAFVGCTGLTDVYFQGTEEEWNAITVAAGNDDLLNATIHFLGDAPAHIHSYSAAVTKEASCSAEGVMTYTCACGDSYTAPIEALPHTPKTVTIPATCTENGAEYTICDVCGERLDAGNEIPAAGHSFETGETYERGKRIFTHTCTVCGYVTQSGDNGRRVITLQQALETLFNRLFAVLFRLPFDSRKR